MTPPPEYAMSGFVLRSPLLPATTLVETVTPLGSTFDESELAALCNVIREQIRTLIALPEVAEALFVASPTLTDSLPAWLRDPSSDKGKRVERTLMSYLARMTTRCTPFGLFAGCSVGRMDAETRLRLDDRSACRRHSRLDMDYLFSLTETINRDVALRRFLLYRPNNTMVRLGGRIRYVEPRVAANFRRYHWVAVPVTPYLEIVLDRCRLGATIDALTQSLIESDAEITPAEALEYLHELIDSHVIVSSLQPPVTGPEATGDVAQQLRELGQDGMATILETARLSLDRLDAAGLGHPASEYVVLAEGLKALPAPVELSRLVQVDMIKPGDIVLGPNVRAEIERCAGFVARFATPADSLTAFRSAFDARYGTAAVPLLQALDPETGISLEELTDVANVPLLAGLPFARGGRNEEGGSWRTRHSVLLRKLQPIWQEGSLELTLEESDLESLYARRDLAPSVDAFSISFTLLADSAAAVDTGDFELLLIGSFGPSGARTLGRFGDMEPSIDAIVREHLRAEEALGDDDVVFAEVVHLPQGRLGNVIRRPVLRDYEMVYMGRSGAPLERQIPLSDVLVTVRGNSIRLWSARLGKRIVPRLTNAHNFTQAGTLPPYRFLCLLQAEGSRVAFSWDWGPLSAAPFLPRVRSGRIILSRAQWNVTPAEIAKFSELESAERFRAARQWTGARRLPRFVFFVQSDNELLVDFENPLSVDMFVKLAANRPRVKLAEVPALPGNLCLRSGDGAFTNEIHIPITRKRAAVAPALDVSAGAGGADIGRTFAPGSEWLYLKIYAPGSEIDRIIADVVRPLAAEAIASGMADRWFFIRYNDPDHHLRLRFRGKPESVYGCLLPRLQRSLETALAGGIVYRLQLDTYQREIERYGGPEGMDLAEQIFQVDSEAVAELLSLLEGDEGAEARWQLALLGADRFIDDFGFNAAEKRAIIARRRKEYGAEFNADAAPMKHSLGDRYRQSRKALAAIWDLARGEDSELAPGLEIWNARSARLAPLAAALRAAEARRALSCPVSTLIDSYLHMSVNRLARGAGREHELVIFDFLNRHYASLDARARGAAAHVRDDRT